MEKVELEEYGIKLECWNELFCTKTYAKNIDSKKLKSSWGDTSNRKSPIAAYENTIKRNYHYLHKNNQSH